MHQLMQGGVEMRKILAAAGGKLVVVDWFAPWCGPCRGIAPFFAELAGKHPDVLFIKVDTEASGENKALAMEAQIRAYPTFHLYIREARVHDFTGASPQKLQSAVEQYKPSGGQPAASPSPAAGAAAGAAGAAIPGAAGDMVKKVREALVKLKGSCATDADFVSASKTLLSFVGNCVTHPSESKYRRIRMGNNAFQSRLGAKPGGVEALVAFGFKEVSDGNPPEDYLVLDQVRFLNSVSDCAG